MLIQTVSTDIIKTMISHNYKCIFVHIPKTGGSSIENVIWPLKSDRVVENLWMGLVRPYYNKYQMDGLQHLTSNQIKTEVGSKVFSSYYKFSVVRNPWEKAVSQFIYTKHKRKDLRKIIDMTKWTSFEKYLNLISENEHTHWMKQVNFICDKNGTIMVDKIIRFENIEKEFELIRQHLGIQNITLPHVNKSKRKHYTKYYNKRTIQIISNLYKEDIELFNYTFGG